MSDPQTGILYRIQNVDFGTYLELWDVDEELLVLRSSKDTELQQWMFIQDASSPGDRYKILAASSQNLAYPVHLGLSTAGDDNAPRPAVPPKAVMGSSSVSLWGLSKQNDGSHAIITKGKDARHEAFLRVTDNGMLDTVEKKLSNNRSVNRSMRWQTVPKDTYRIRTLNGAALDMSSSLQNFTVEAVRKDYRQQWEVEPRGNGMCLISMKADEQRIYLGWQRGKDGIAEIAPSKDPVEWIVKLLSEYTYSITFYYSVGDKDQTTLKLALSVTDDEVLLKPRKIAHNQIWFLENVDAFESSNFPRKGPQAAIFDNVDASDSSELPRKNPPAALRYGEISQGLWKIRNVQTAQSASFLIMSDQWVYAENSIGNETKIDYINNGITFYMSYSTGGRKYVSFTGSAVKIVDGSGTATTWVLERENDPVDGYVYYICPSFDRTQCISGETTTVQRFNIFNVAAKKIGSRIHQWKFVAP